jgi:hypothetical protein
MRASHPIAVSLFLVIASSIPGGAQPAQPTAPHANRMSHGDLQAYHIFLSNSPPLKVWLTARVRTDSCNTIFLSGGFRKLEMSPGTAQTMQQDYVADVHLTTTLASCPGPAGPEKILNSEVLVIQPYRNTGGILSTIYVPSGYELHTEQ